MTEVNGDFFTESTTDKHEHHHEQHEVSGPNLQAVTEALFDNCEDYHNIQNNKNSSIWRPY